MSKCTYPSRSCDGILKQVMVILYQVDVHERHRRAAEMISAKSCDVLIFEILSLQLLSENEKKMYSVKYTQIKDNPENTTTTELKTTTTTTTTTITTMLTIKFRVLLNVMRVLL